jgi:MFS family permease
VLSVSQLIGWGTLYYSFSLFSEPMLAEFSWSSSTFNLALTIGFVTWAFSAPLVGNALDRYGGRTVMGLGSVLGVVALLIWATAPTLPLFYGAWLLMGIAMAACLYEPAFYVLTRAFPQKYKQVITWLTLAGGFASTLFIPLIEWSIGWMGWQETLLAMAGLNLLVALPLHMWGLPSHGNKQIKQRSSIKPWDLSLFKEQSFKPKSFAGLSIWFVLFNSTATGVTFLIIPLLSEIGTSQQMIIWGYSLIGPMQVLGRLLLMWSGNGLHALRTGTVVSLMAPAGIAMIAFQPSTWMSVVLFALLFGTAKGIMTIIRGTVVAEQMDFSVYARTNGWLSLSSTLSKAVTPVLFASLWTITGDPKFTLWMLALLGGLAPVGIGLVWRDK